MQFDLEFELSFYEEMQKLCKWIDENSVPVDTVYKNGTIHYY